MPTIIVEGPPLARARKRKLATALAQPCRLILVSGLPAPAVTA